MKRAIVIIAIAALVIVATIALAQVNTPRSRPMAQPKMCGQDGWCMGMGMCERTKKELGLTPDQVTQLEAIHKDFLDSTQAARDQMKAKKAQMIDLWTADTPDAAAIKDMAAQVDTLRDQIRDSAIDHAISAAAVLNADQLAKVKDWLRKNPHMMMGFGCGMCCEAGMRCPNANQAAGTGRGPGCGCCTPR